MKWFTYTALAAVLSVPALAVAQNGAKPARGDRPHSPEETFRRADADHDGKVSFEELRAQRPNLSQVMFDRIDQDGDGFLSPADRVAQRGARAGKGAKNGEARARMLAKMLECDADGNGSVSYDELVAAKPGFPRTDFDRLDRNSDGVISQDDMLRARRQGDRPHPPRPPKDARNKGDADRRQEFRKRMVAADRDGDGSVSFSEAQVQFPGMTQERFNTLDRNKDGAIGPEDRPKGRSPRTGSAPKPPAP
jgi:Ca2+-binding EF-hand superfamily protein